MIGQSLTDQSLNPVSKYGGIIHQSVTDELRFSLVKSKPDIKEDFLLKKEEKKYGNYKAAITAQKGKVEYTRKRKFSKLKYGITVPELKRPGKNPGLSRD